MTMRLRGLGVAVLLTVAGGCSAGAGRHPVGPNAAQPDPGFVVRGDPEAPGGASWSYRGKVGGVTYDLTGVLLKPPGAGPFPAVLLSHGAGGNAARFGAGVGQEMVRWGLVCIAVNYVHAGGVPLGAPGEFREKGATPANLLRAQRTYELLRQLGYVDMKRVAAHGYSAGAFLTAALVAAHPGEFRVASHGAGGVRPGELPIGGVPAPAELHGMRTPYQIHHGDSDDVVPLAWDQRLDSLLSARHIPHQLRVYRGETHAGPARSPVMLQSIHDWYTRFGMF